MGARQGNRLAAAAGNMTGCASSLSGSMFRRPGAVNATLRSPDVDDFADAAHTHGSRYALACSPAGACVTLLVRRMPS